MRLTTLREIPDDPELHQGWNALVMSVARPQVFYTYEWSLAVQRAYSTTLNPLIFLGYDQPGSLCGIASLAASPERNEVTFLCATTADYCDFVSQPEHKQMFVAAVLGELRKQGFRRITLTNLPADSDTLGAIRGAKSRGGYRCFARTAYLCAQISLETMERNPKDNKPVLPRKKMVRRFISALGRETPVRLIHARTWDEIQPILPGFMQAHVARFLLTGRISNIARPERRVFLEQLARLLAASGWMKMSCLASGENKLAWNYGFQFGDTFFWYQPTFDSTLEKYSPGFCLLSKVIEEAAANPALKTVDLGLGDEGYKDRFSNHSRRTVYATLRSAGADHMREIARYSITSAVRVLPPVERGARTAFARVKNLKQKLRSLRAREACKWLAKRVRFAIASRDEVYFYELTNLNPGLAQSDSISLKTIDLNILAIGAMQNSDDEGTLAYLLRCAHRLQTEAESTGFALTNASGELLHFTWAGPFERFHWSEFNSGLPAPAPNSVVLFDSWTPVSQRGRGFYAPTLGLVVARMREEGKRLWGFSASTNTSSVRGLEKAGLRRSFTVLRYRLLWWQRVFQRAATNPSSS